MQSPLVSVNWSTITTVPKHTSTRKKSDLCLLVTDFGMIAEFTYGVFCAYVMKYTIIILLFLFLKIFFIVQYICAHTHLVLSGVAGTSWYGE